MQLANYSEWDKPIYEKRYRRCKIIRFGKEKNELNWICDFEGNFNLMCANERAIRLLTYIKTHKCQNHNG